MPLLAPPVLGVAVVLLHLQLLPAFLFPLDVAGSEDDGQRSVAVRWSTEVSSAVRLEGMAWGRGLGLVEADRSVDRYCRACPERIAGLSVGFLPPELRLSSLGPPAAGAALGEQGAPWGWGSRFPSSCGMRALWFCWFCPSDGTGAPAPISCSSAHTAPRPHPRPRAGPTTPLPATQSPPTPTWESSPGLGVPELT